MILGFDAFLGLVNSTGIKGNIPISSDNCDFAQKTYMKVKDERGYDKKRWSVKITAKNPGPFMGDIDFVYTPLDFDLVKPRSIMIPYPEGEDGTTEPSSSHVMECLRQIYHMPIADEEVEIFIIKDTNGKSVRATVFAFETAWTCTGFTELVFIVPEVKQVSDAIPHAKFNGY